MSGKIGAFLVSVSNILVFSLGFFPLLIYIWVIFNLISFNELWHFILIPFLITIGILITLFYQILFNGLIINIFNLKYEPGVYTYSYKEKMAKRWVQVCSLYTPIRKILEIIPLGGMKNIYLRFLGMKIGDNSLVGGVIKDPCLTEFGDNVTMGEYAIIYGHIHNYEKQSLIMNQVKIGNNCVIGAGSIIMPGVVLKDNVSLAAGAVVKKNQVLKKNGIYAGIPAKKIKQKK